MNIQKLEVAGVSVQTDREGRFCLNDLHRAAIATGVAKDIRPNEWMALSQTVELAESLIAENPGNSPINATAGRYGGTFVAKELVYAYAMWISPTFHLKVIRAYDALAAGDTRKAEEIARSSLAAQRRAKALEISAKTAELICIGLPHLSGEARQVIFAHCINPVAGTDVVPLPVLERHFYTAEQVGQELGISANKVGRLANEHGVKTADYGIFVLDKSRFSAKQVEAFRYNDAGIERLRALLLREERPEQSA